MQGRGSLLTTRITLGLRRCCCSSWNVYDVALHAYVLMSNHCHLIAEARRANLGRWTHWLMTSCTVYFNRRHGPVGYFFKEGTIPPTLAKGKSKKANLAAAHRLRFINRSRFRVKLRWVGTLSAARAVLIPGVHLLSEGRQSALRFASAVARELPRSLGAVAPPCGALSGIR